VILAFGDREPRVDPSAVVFEGATVVGSVHLGPRSSVWFGAVVRADVDDVRIGARSNVQDRCVVHVTTKRFSTRLGDDVTVGHSVTLHGCEIGDRVLVGIGSIVLDGCDVGSDCIIGAGSLLVPGTKIPSGHLAVGSPAVVKRPLRDEERAHLVRSAENYALLSARYRELGIA
jgi:carbonic anhydrase/acetyltransferase-like protein (isoleucine patch superfamily)